MCVPGGSSRCAVVEAEQRSFPISSLTADRDSDLSGGNSAASSRCSDWTQRSSFVSTWRYPAFMSRCKTVTLSPINPSLFIPELHNFCLYFNCGTKAVKVYFKNNACVNSHPCNAAKIFSFVFYMTKVFYYCFSLCRSYCETNMFKCSKKYHDDESRKSVWFEGKTLTVVQNSL